MKVVTVSTEAAPAAIGAYSQGVVAGDFVFCSGQMPLDPVSGGLVSGTVRQQTCRVLDNLEAVLATANSGLEDIIKTTLYLTDLEDFAEVNAVYGERLSPHRPARVTVEVARLPLDAHIQIDCIARQGSSRTDAGGYTS